MKEKTFLLFGPWLVKVRWDPDWYDVQVGLATQSHVYGDGRLTEILLSFVVFGIGFQVSNVS